MARLVADMEVTAIVSFPGAAGGRAAAVIDGAVYRAGDVPRDHESGEVLAEGLRVEEIAPSEVTFSHRGTELVRELAER